MKMSQLLLVVHFMIAFVLVGCDGRVNTKQETASYRLQHDYDTACTQGKCPCASPLGPIVDGLRARLAQGPELGVKSEVSRV